MLVFTGLFIFFIKFILFILKMFLCLQHQFLIKKKYIMLQITLTKTEFKLVGKVTYKEVSKESNIIGKKEYNNIIESCPFFRRLGGSETLTRAYTCDGYKPVKLISKSPDRNTKIVREFKFEWID